MDQPAYMNLLLACLQDIPADELSLQRVPQRTQGTAAEWDALLAPAHRQEVAPLLFARLKCTGQLVNLPPACQAALERAYYENCVHHLRLYQQLKTIISWLQEQGIAVIVLKGAALAATVYPDPALRMMHDLDLLVDHGQLPAALAVMHALGYTFLDEAPPADLTEQHHLPRLVHADAAAAVELHWTITPPGRYQAMDTAALWRRAVTADWAGATALVLSPTDQLLHLGLHASYHHQFQQGIRFLCDVDALLRRHGARIDWAAVEQQAQQREWTRGLHLAFYLAQQLFAAPIPPAVLAALQPADFPAQVVNWACWFLVTQECETPQVSSAFVKLWEAPTEQLRLQRVQQRFAVQKAFLAKSHQVPPEALRLHHYLRFYLGMLQRYFPQVWRLLCGEAHVLAETKRMMAFTAWLNSTAEAGHCEEQ